MEVLLGPNFGIDVRDRSGVVPVAADQHTVASCLFLEDDIACTRNGPGSVFGIGSRGKAPEQNEESSDSSSSIGAPDDSEDEEDNDEVSSKEVQSHFNGAGLGSLGSMEDSLPIKRGLSNHFTGKSKSFANLLEVSAVKDLEKTENPFNKRRRVLVSAKWSSRRSLFYSSSNPKSMPLLALNEEEDEDEDGHHQQQLEYTSSSSQSSSSTENKEQEEQERVPRKYIDKRLLSFKSRSCFSLSDLQEHDEQDED